MSVSSRAIRPCLCVALLALTASHAVAQEAPKDPRREAGMWQTVSVEFRGGTLTDFVTAVQAAGEDINILLPGNADKVQVPALVLKNVAVESALDAVSDIVSDQHQVNVKTHRGAGQPVYAVRVQERARQSRRGARTAGTATTQMPQPQNMVRVLSLQPLTKSLPTDPKGVDIVLRPETILTAVDTGLAVSHTTGAPKPLIKYHAESGLLFVRGSVEQTELVRSVVQRLEEDVNNIRNQARMHEHETRRRKSVDAKKETGAKAAKPTSSK